MVNSESGEDLTNILLTPNANASKLTGADFQAATGGRGVEIAIKRVATMESGGK
ncbi:MAG TPA: hypothetical protein VM120_04320 [Bryobacteraceae bacterium]|nr:hypothetical protein [Bryobacteraceae bacterium]